MNRTCKDSVFSLYFGEKTERLVELYNALNDAHYPPDTKVEINTLEDAIFMDRINDLSFLLDGKLIVLLEHQSTISKNVCLRLLIYCARLYEKLLTTENIYQEKRIFIPRPVFIVLYDGVRPCPEHQVLRLSDSWFQEGMDTLTDLGMIDGDEGGLKNFLLELEVHVYNINHGMNPEIIEKCAGLREYSGFIARVRKNIAMNMTKEEAMTEAIRYCVRADMMAEFLSKHGSEVENMLFTEWNWDTALDVRYKEGHEDGFESGMEKGIQEGERKRREEREESILHALKNGLSDTLITDIFGCDRGELEQIKCKL
jgi:predicted transposase/invertase (TIGR01784 family)